MITGTGTHWFSDHVTDPLQRGRCEIGFKYEKVMIEMSRTPERAVHEEGRRLLRMGSNFAESQGASRAGGHRIGARRGRYDLAVGMVITELPGPLLDINMLGNIRCDPPLRWKRPRAFKSTSVHLSILLN